MFTIYPQLANRLKAMIPGLRTIDYDQGQLANPQNAYPIDYPAALISVENVKWADNGQKVQKGSITIAVTLAIVPTVQMHQSSPTLWLYPAKMQFINHAYTCLKGYTGGDTITGIDNDEEEIEIEGIKFTPLTRTGTQRMKRYDNIQAFTHVFTCTFTDRSAQPVYIKPPEPISPVKLELKVYTPNTVAVFPENL